LCQNLTKEIQLQFFPSSPATKTAPTPYQRAKSCLENIGFTVLEGSLTVNKIFIVQEA